jgi:hypothetical protein
MIDAADGDAKAAVQRLDDMFATTDVLYPKVGDPLSANLAIDSLRWLAQDHENAYSDWLAWILQQQDDPSLVLALFGVPSIDTTAGWTIEREVATSYGRLDILIRNPVLGVLCIEVKTESVPGPDQLERYSKWLAGRRSLGLILLAIDQPEDDPSGAKYRFWPWKNVALGLRTWASTWLNDPSKLYDAVMTLAFCGAIERNLLSLHGGGLNALRTADYLDEVLDHAKKTSR